jgi:hypothetical protein
VKAKATILGLAGVAIAAAVPLTYLFWWASDLTLGDRTWICWAAIGVGAVLAGIAALRPPEGTGTIERGIAALCLVVTLVGGGLFAWYSFGISARMPQVWSEPLLGRRLPAITLVTKDGQPFDLEKESRQGVLARKKILLSFFRGTW